MAENNLHVNKDKNKCFQKSVEHLGHIIVEKGLHTTDEKIATVLKVPKPTNVKELNQFLSLVKYYYTFIPNFASKSIVQII